MFFIKILILVKVVRFGILLLEILILNLQKDVDLKFNVYKLRKEKCQDVL